MKILHIVPSYFPAFKFGGPIESVYLLNKTLVKKGIEIDVITTNAGLLEDKTIQLCSWINLDGVRVKYFPYYFYEHYNFSPELFFEVFNVVKDYDLIHIAAVWNFPALVGSIASCAYKKPYIISPHGTLNKEAVYIKSKLLKQIYYYLLAMHCIKNANALHFTSEDEQINVTNFLKLRNQSFVIPNGIDLNEYSKLSGKGEFKKKHPVLKDKKYILFLGRITPKKGLDLLVQSFKELVKLDHDLFLVIAGPDNEGYGRVVRNQLKSYGLMEKTLFTGMLMGEEKLSAYIDAEVFILPSYSENFGMTVVEAMACGVPVVVSDKVGISNVIKENNAGLVVKTDSETLYDGVKSLLANKETRCQFATNGKYLVHKMYNIDKVADMMINAYQEIINGFKG